MHLNLHTIQAIAYVESRSIVRNYEGPFIIGDKRCLKLGKAGELGIFQMTPIAYKDVIKNKEYETAIKLFPEFTYYDHSNLIDPRYALICVHIYLGILQKRWGMDFVCYYNSGDPNYARKIVEAMYMVEAIIWKSRTENKK